MKSFSKVIALFLIATLVLPLVSFTAVPVFAEATVVVTAGNGEIDATEVSIGDEIIVPVTISQWPAEKMYAVQVDTLFDPEVLEFIELESAMLPAISGAMLLPALPASWTVTPVGTANSTGKIVGAFLDTSSGTQSFGSLSINDATNGTDVLFNLKFKVLDTVNTTLEVNKVLMSDFETGAEVQHTSTSGEIETVDCEVVFEAEPEPVESTVITAGAGEIDASDLSVGDELVVPVTVSKWPAEKMYAVQVDTLFDTEVLEFVGLEGVMLPVVSGMLLPVLKASWTVTPVATANSTGKIVGAFLDTSSGTQSFGSLSITDATNGTDVLFNLKFKVLATTNTTLKVDKVLMSDFETGAEVQHTSTSGELETVDCEVFFGDAPVLSSDATLADLTFNGVTVEGFNAEVEEYDVYSTYEEKDDIVISAEANDMAADVDIDAPASYEEGLNTVTITVTAEDGTTKTYTLYVNVDAPIYVPSTDARLYDLTVDGVTVDGFNADTLTYTLTVENDVTEVTVAAEVNDNSSTVTGDGVVTLNVGENTVTVVVTAEDGTTKTYTLVITREEAPVEPPVVDGTVITAGAGEIDASDLSVGDELIVPVTVSKWPAEKMYAVQVDTLFDTEVLEFVGLEGVMLPVVSGMLLPVLKASWTVTPVATANATGKIVGAFLDTSSGTQSFGSLSITDATNGTDVLFNLKFKVLATTNTTLKVDKVLMSDFETGAEVQHTSTSGELGTVDCEVIFGAGEDPVLPSTDATLSGLTVDGVTVAGFDADTLTYTLTVENDVTEVTVAATANDAKATVTGDGVVTLNVGENTVTVVVTAEDGTTKTYTLVITREEAPVEPPVVDGTVITAGAGEIDASDLSVGDELVVPVTVSKWPAEKMYAVQVDTLFDTEVLEFVGLEGVMLPVVSGMLLPVLPASWTVTPVGTANATGKIVGAFLDTSSGTQSFGSLSITDATNGTDVLFNLKFKVLATTNTTLKVDKVLMSDFETGAEVQHTSTSGELGTVDCEVIFGAGEDPVLPSTDATLSGLTVDGVTVAGFDADTLTYTLTVENDVTEVTVAATANDAKATVTGDGVVTLNVGENTVTVVVTAEDGTTKTYTLVITREEAPVEPPVTDKEVALEFGTPSYTKDAISIPVKLVKYPESLTDIASLTVTYSISETLKFVRIDPVVAGLTANDVSGTAFSWFASGAPISLDALAVANNVLFNIVVDEINDDVTGVAIVEITNDNCYIGDSGYTCEVDDFEVDKIEIELNKISSDATLSDLKVNGTTVDGFDAETLTYDVTLPADTTSVSVVATENHAKASAVVNAPASLVTGKNTVTVTVTAEDGTTKTYTINVVVLASTDATLKDLTVNGVTVDGFDAETLTYDVTLPADTTSVSVVATENHAKASAVVNAPASLVTGKNTVTVTVTAEDGVTTKTYTVNVIVLKSSDATLKDLTVNGVTVDGFDAETLTYDVTLPADTTSVSVVATENHAKASAVVNTPDLVTGKNTVTVTVTAEDGVTTKTYTIYVVVLASTDATLSDLTIDGVTVDGFDAETLTYDVTLPADTTSVSVVATKNHAKANVVVNTPALVVGKNTVTVTVTAEDGETTKTYTINVVVLPSTDATLKALAVDGESVENFDADGLEYIVAVDSDVTAVVVTATANHAGATVKVTAPDSLAYGNNTVTVVVTAQDGETTKTYTITVVRAYVEVEVILTKADAYKTGMSLVMVKPANALNAGEVLKVNGKTMFYTEYDGVVKYVALVENFDAATAKFTAEAGESRKIVYGDIDASGKINAGDAFKVNKFAAGGTVPNFVNDAEYAKIAADVDASGKINAGDAFRINKRAAGVTDAFPAATK